MGQVSIHECKASREVVSAPCTNARRLNESVNLASSTQVHMLGHWPIQHPPFSDMFTDNWVSSPSCSPPNVHGQVGQVSSHEIKGVQGVSAHSGTLQPSKHSQTLSTRNHPHRPATVDTVNSKSSIQHNACGPLGQFSIIHNSLTASKDKFVSRPSSPQPDIQEKFVSRPSSTQLNIQVQVNIMPIIHTAQHPSTSLYHAHHHTV